MSERYGVTSLDELPAQPRVRQRTGGRPDVALGYARRAIELQESFAEYAVKDDDLVSIRDRL